MELSRREKILIALLTIAIILAVVFLVFYIKNYLVKRVVIISDSPAVVSSNVYLPPEKLKNPPEIIKAIYVTGYSAGSKKYLDYLSGLFKNTEINAVVVDIKDSSGYVTYESGADEVKKYNIYKGAIKDIDALVRFFHDQNIYVIGRVAVFEDPMYSKARPDLAIYNLTETTDLSKPVLWQDNNGLSWLDPSSKDAWDYNISVARDAFYHGFDEVNFDYVRFPSDGKTDSMGFPFWDGKVYGAEVIKGFFQYLRSNLKGEKISADLFGQTTTNTDDMGIGQLLENSFENFDFVSPMVYPSHYINGFMGYNNPAEHPYEIVKYSMETALAREKAFFANSTLSVSGATTKQTGHIQEAPVLAKFRPWVQDFNLGAVYTPDMVKAEIKATQDALGDNYAGFMLWNAANIYTQEAILKPN